MHVIKPSVCNVNVITDSTRSSGKGKTKAGTQVGITQRSLHSAKVAGVDTLQIWMFSGKDDEIDCFSLLPNTNAREYS